MSFVLLAGAAEAASDGDLTVDAEDEDGDAATYASVVLYTSDWDTVGEKGTGSDGSVTWEDRSGGDYHVELYGGDGAFWASNTVTVDGDTSHTIRRRRPYLLGVTVTDEGDGDGTLETGETITVSPKVQNDAPTDQRTRVRIVTDGDKSSPWYDDVQRGPVTIASGDHQWFGRDLTFDDPGTYHVRLSAEAEVDGSYTTTDASTWTASFDVSSAAGPSCSADGKLERTANPGDTVELGVRCTAEDGETLDLTWLRDGSQDGSSSGSSPLEDTYSTSFDETGDHSVTLRAEDADGETAEVSWTVHVEEQATPSPEITTLEVPDTATSGEPFRMTVAVENAGGAAADLGHLTVGFPTDPESGDVRVLEDGTTTPQNLEKSAGETIWKGYGDAKMEAEYPLAEGFASPWPASTTHTLAVEVTPTEETLTDDGTFPVEAKLTAKKDGTWYAEPPRDGSGADRRDQQEEYVRVREIPVEEGDDGGGALTTWSFADGLEGWTADLHECHGDRVSEGDGGWVDAHDGSVRLHVDGGPNHYGLYRQVDVDKGDRVRVDYHIHQTDQPGGPRIKLHTPDCDGWLLDKDNRDSGDNGTLVGTVPEDPPDGAELEVRLGVWPGEITTHVERVTVAGQSGEGGANASIRSFDPPTGSAEPGETVTGEVTVENTGETERSFWVGLSYLKPGAQPEDDDAFLHVDPVETDALSSGETATLTLERTVPEEAPSGQYKAWTAVWGGYDAEKDVMVEPLFDAVRGEDAFRVGDGELTDAELARKFAPILKFSSEAQVFPVPVDYAFDNWELKNADGEIVKGPGFSVDALPTGEDSKNFYLNEPVDDREGYCPDSWCLDPDLQVEQYKEATEGGKYQPVSYARVGSTDDPGRTFIQYFLFYPINDWSNNHEGDWEFVQVNLDAKNSVESTYYSRHYWPGYNIDVEETSGAEMKGKRPVVYVARGSHANYPFRVDSGEEYLDAGAPGLEDADGKGQKLRPGSGDNGYEVKLLSGDEHWLDYKGLWGETNKAPFGKGSKGPKMPRKIYLDDEVRSEVSPWTSPLDWAGKPIEIVEKTYTPGEEVSLRYEKGLSGELSVVGWDLPSGFQLQATECAGAGGSETCKVVSKADVYVPGQGPYTVTAGVGGAQFHQKVWRLRPEQPDCSGPGVDVDTDAPPVVVLVHGWTGDKTSLSDIEQALEADPAIGTADELADPVKAVEYTAAKGEDYHIPDMAAQVQSQIRDALEGTSGRPVVIVSHSMGGLVGRVLIQQGCHKAPNVLSESAAEGAISASPADALATISPEWQDRVVGLYTMGTPHKGVDGSVWGPILELIKGNEWEETREDMHPNSPFMASLTPMEGYDGRLVNIKAGGSPQQTEDHRDEPLDDGVVPVPKMKVPTDRKVTSWYYPDACHIGGKVGIALCGTDTPHYDDHQQLQKDLRSDIKTHFFSHQPGAVRGNQPTIPEAGQTRTFTVSASDPDCDLEGVTWTVGQGASLGSQETEISGCEDSATAKVTFTSAQEVDVTAKVSDTRADGSSDTATDSASWPVYVQEEDEDIVAHVEAGGTSGTAAKSSTPAMTASSETEVDVSTGEGRVSVTVSSQGDGGIVSVDLAGTSLAGIDPGSLDVELDGSSIPPAESYRDLVAREADGEAGFLVSEGTEGVEVLVSVPHFSTREITLEEADGGDDGASQDTGPSFGAGEELPARVRELGRELAAVPGPGAGLVVALLAGVARAALRGRGRRR